MEHYPSRKARLRSEKNRKKRLRKLFINYLLAVFILFCLGYSAQNTYSYFSDTEQISGTIGAAKDFCEGLNGSSDYWHKYCKDNSGGGNGPEPKDEDTGDGTDPDNPGHNKDDCDDHTSAPCSEGKKNKDSSESNITTTSPPETSSDNPESSTTTQNRESEISIENTEAKGSLENQETKTNDQNLNSTQDEVIESTNSNQIPKTETEDSQNTNTEESAVSDQ